MEKKVHGTKSPDLVILEYTFAISELNKMVRCVCVLCNFGFIIQNTFSCDDCLFNVVVYLQKFKIFRMNLPSNSINNTRKRHLCRKARRPWYKGRSDLFSPLGLTL